MGNLGEFTNEKLQKLKNINRLLSISALAWFVILVLDILFAENIIVRVNIINTLLFYLFPFTLYVIVILTFYSSHGILENKNYKSVVLFVIIQLIGFLVYTQVKIEIPPYFLEQKILSVFIVTGLFIGISWLTFVLVKDKDNKRLIDEINEKDIDQSIAALKLLTYNKSYSNLGLTVSAIFSTVIITLVNIRTFDNDLRFILSFGVLLGVLFVALLSHKDQTVLAILSLLDPNGAKYLFALKSIKDKSEFEIEKLKDESAVYDLTKDIHIQKTQVAKDLYLARLESLVAEMESLKNEELFNIYESDLKEQIQSFKEMSAREKVNFLANFDEKIRKLRAQDLIGLEDPSVNYMNYDDLPLDEKMANLIGLSDEEISEAITSDLIDPDQAFIWNLPNQHKIKSAISDFESDRYGAYASIFVAQSVTKFYSPTSPVFAAMLDLIQKKPESGSSIKGLEAFDLREFRLKTAIKEYSVIVKLGPEWEFLIHAILPAK